MYVYLILGLLRLKFIRKLYSKMYKYMMYHPSQNSEIT